MTTTIKKRMTNSGEYLQKVIVWNISMLLTAHGLSQTALTEPLKMTRGGVSAKMKNKNTWSIPDIAALADYFGVPVTSLLDDTLMRQMLGEGNLGASLVAATTARFPVRAAEGQADGLKPLETKGSGPRYLVETGAGGYPRQESDNQRRRANHTLISEPTTTSATPIQNGMPNVTPNRSVLEAVENSGVAYEPIASVSILPCSMPYPQHA